MELKERIRILVKMFGGTQAEFARLIGTSQSTVTSWVSRGNIPTSALKKISAACPNVNIDWIVTGNGDMLKDVSPAVIYSQYAARLGAFTGNAIYTKGTKDVTIRVQ